MSSVDTAFLHQLTTQTDGLSVTVLPPLQCKTCHTEFFNRKVCAATKCVREEQLLRSPLYPESDGEVDCLRAIKK